MRSDNTTLISKENITALNRSNDDLALTDTQIEYFLKVQHSLGKILYFDQHGLEKFIIVQPQSLVNILRSFITDEHFWPNDKSLRDILHTMINTGEIAKKDLLKFTFHYTWYKV
jgi:H2-forming N5,N10-methylenetetrahydromethanopterin dehydrogenase-like enzyme